MHPAGKKSGPRATLADFLAIPEEQRFHELIDGELVQKALPSPKHALGQAGVVHVLAPFRRRAGGPPDRPGGWWFLTEVDILFGEEPLRPDVAGWRRERLSTMPDGPFMTILPDWICEIVSESNASNDTVKKKRIYHRFQVPHYWIIDPRQETLSVLRWSVDGYTEVVAAERNERVRAEPFEAIELEVGFFFGADADEPDS